MQKSPRYQGGGSSHINSYKVTGALEAVKDICPVSYAQGYILDEDRTDENLLAEAVKTAQEADVAVIFAVCRTPLKARDTTAPICVCPNARTS